ncbi:metal-dependent hydrolase [Staphylococcus sp. 17KM0847]|uniref:metal-dependent hydrolase n=1 Tax=Staphylococcus sp. 17KM0847 TaxID=2583989 RepID=UPI0015DCB3BB|nr:metal-dependent hydrolase [Staphylococcus sp. 17KM0847]QLK86561.1 metal-dependent hydrolase [Staphylococcus sp. 17KM0847]
MTGKTHIAAGLCVGTATALHYNLDIYSTATCIFLAGIASIFPDICHTKSKIGRKFPIISWLIKQFFGHRTLTHSLLFLFLIYMILHFIETPIYYMISIIYGMLSHVILDMLTPRGVRLLFPLPISIGFPIRFKTGGLLDVSLATAFGLMMVYMLFDEAFHYFFQLLM